MTRDDLHPGQSLVWRHQPRGGYGYVYTVPVTVVRVGPKRVLVRAPLANGLGGDKDVWVRPEYLGAPSASGTRP